MTIYTGTIYLFRATPDETKKEELETYRERVFRSSSRHNLSYGYMGKKVRDLEGNTPFEQCGFGYLPTLDMAKLYTEDLTGASVYDAAVKCHSQYQSTVFWPSQIPSAVDAYDPENKQFQSGAFVVSRSKPDMEKVVQRMGPFLQAMKALYDKYEYKVLYTGQKAYDSMGETGQTQVSIGLFPSVEQAIACHEDKAYAEVHDLRQDLLLDFELALFGPMKG